MSGIISSIFEARARKKMQKASGEGLYPIEESDCARRVEMLDSFEEAGFGWFWASDAQGRLIYLSKGAIEKLGLDRDGLMGLSVLELFGNEDQSGWEGEKRPLRLLLNSKNLVTRRCVKIRGAKGQLWWQIAGSAQFDKGGIFTGYRGSIEDITESYENRVAAERLAHFDGLTGLANRTRFARRIEETLRAFTGSKRSCALLMLGLDRFKKINESMGHQAGDEVLKQVSERLVRIVGEKGEIARFGGNEFQILVPDEDDRGILADLVQRIIQMVSQPYPIDGNRAVIGTSVGIAIAPYDGVDCDALLEAAGMALHAARSNGAGKYRFYTADLRQRAMRRAALEADLRDAISREQLQMHFQPIVDAESHRMKCLEALIRWNHPEHGWVAPSEFIPVAEEMGIIKEIGTWALKTVCEAASKWPVDLNVAINVSAAQFDDEKFPKIVKQAIEYAEIEPSRIELEITESIFVGDFGRASKIFSQLKKLGVRLALDDFGTGYSSLSYLRDAPFDKVKIDQSFVRGCSEKGNNNKAIISAIVGLASALEMETVAEGIESKDELDAVCKQGVSSLQGRIFSDAIANGELVERLESGNLTYEPRGPEKHRAERRTEFRRIGLVHEDYRYNVILRNLSKTGALVDGLLNVPVGTDAVLDLGGGQLVVATVRRVDGSALGLQFEAQLIDDGDGGLCTRYRVSPYQIEAAGRPLTALTDDAYSQLQMAQPHNGRRRQFTEIEVNFAHANVA
jgi:diguanylate cyclase (GGDEF)-like protein/PAS domain S-box-containing protein